MKIRGLCWWIAGLLLLVSILNYLDRNTVSVLAPSIQRDLDISLLTCQPAPADSGSASSAKSGPRPVFHSKIHVPVQLAQTAIPLPPAGYQLVFADEFNGDKHDDMNIWLTSIATTLKGDRWVEDSKLPGAAMFDYVRVYQNPKYRDAEVVVRAALLRHAKQPESDKAHNVGGRQHLNRCLPSRYS